jgi:LmbE family N-acetylglucosaminyl deacetylase
VRSAAGPDGLTNPVIAVTAHQDDDTLTLGPAIEQALAAGRYVIVVLATDGRSSGVKTKIGLDSVPFSLARDAEFGAAMKAQGVNQVYVEGMVDGSLSAGQAAAIAWKWTDRFPQASFLVQTYHDSHRDHAALGQAFQNRWNDTGQVLDIKHFVKIEDRTLVQGLVSTPLHVITGGDRTRAAALEYARVDTANGRYGIGRQSVYDDFTAIATDTTTRYHLPTE